MTAHAAVAVVAGSGLDLRPLFDSVVREIDFADVQGLAAARVPGHAGKFVFGRCKGIPVILQSGRLHVYEGISVHNATEPVAALHRFGARTILFTNAAGGLMPDMQPGDLMAADAIRLWPCASWKDHPDSLDVDLVAEGCAWRGAYHWVHGPCYETRAEIAALQALGGSAVGMSTAPEVARAQSLDLRTGVISCITNNCCTPRKLTHEHVLRTAAAASARLCEVLRSALSRNFAPVNR